MGTTSVAQATPDRARPAPTSPLFILSVPRNRRDKSMIGAVAGWYYDPDDQAIYRYWDGQAWTDRGSDIFPAGQS